VTVAAAPSTPGDEAARERRRRRLLWAGALAWLGALLVLLGLFRSVGEESWPVVLLLYLPRHPWLGPGLLLLPFAWRRGRRALLWPLAVGGLLWLFPVMGFVLPRLSPPPAGPTLRVLTYNTTHGVDGVEGLRALVQEARPDLVLFQWTSHLADEALSGPGFEGWTVQRVAQFTVASRFPVRSLEAFGVPSGSGPPCAHAVVETPLGTLDVYSIRPQSARDELGATHHRGLRQRLRELIQNESTGRMSELASFREAQVRSIVEEVAKARYPVLIAGDSNLPDGSLLLRRYLGGFRDAFAEAGWGFGYTHPARLPWMRLDRVLLGPGLGAVSVEVFSRRVSAHRAVVAEVVGTPAG
jgi:endonuclease/exonuclease/phosphatase (EEP) superfamily protein YafD